MFPEVQLVESVDGRLSAIALRAESARQFGASLRAECLDGRIRARELHERTRSALERAAQLNGRANAALFVARDQLSLAG
jgi:hypothetical protein